MSLVIEDGTGVADANSYATVDEARTYATLRGLTLPVSDADVEKLLVKACDFLESLESKYKGQKTVSTNVLAWPRKCVYLYNACEPIDKNSIPVVLKSAQCQLAFDGNSTDLMPTGTGRQVIRTKVDVIETEYSDTKSATLTPRFNKAMAILGPLLNDSGFSLATRRV